MLFYLHENEKHAMGCHPYLHVSFFGNYVNQAYRDDFQETEDSAVLISLRNTTLLVYFQVLLLRSIRIRFLPPHNLLQTKLFIVENVRCH